MSDYNFFGISADFTMYDYKDKERNMRNYISYMLNRTMQMFEYEGLPDTIPKKMLELYIMINGHSVVIEHEDNLYVCFGNWGGMPDEYYVPTKYVVANPYLNISKEFTINEDCILVYNDSLYVGMMPLFKRYASALVENDLTMNIVDIQSRIMTLIDAADDRTKASAEEYLHDIESGHLGVIASNAFFNGVRAQPYGDRGNVRLTDLIEYEQYIKASYYNEIGLNANYNMKRESINSNESQLNDDMLLPLVDDMHKCRIEFCDRINNMWGTDIVVNLSSSWRDNQEELLMEQAAKAVQIASTVIPFHTDNDTSDVIDNIHDSQNISDSESNPDAMQNDSDNNSGISIDIDTDKLFGDDLDDRGDDDEQED